MIVRTKQHLDVLYTYHQLISSNVIDLFCFNVSNFNCNMLIYKLNVNQYVNDINIHYTAVCYYNNNMVWTIRAVETVLYLISNEFKIICGL